jgi:hypothetical protein
MSDSSSEPDAHKAKREAAKLLKSAEKSFRRWAKRAGGHLATAFGENIQQPKQKRAQRRKPFCHPLNASVKNC